MRVSSVALIISAAVLTSAAPTESYGGSSAQVYEAPVNHVYEAPVNHGSYTAPANQAPSTYKVEPVPYHVPQPPTPQSPRKEVTCGTSGGVWIRMNAGDGEGSRNVQTYADHVGFRSSPQTEPTLYGPGGYGKHDPGQKTTLFGKSNIATHDLKVEMVWYIKTYMPGNYTLNVIELDDTLRIGAGNDCDKTEPKHVTAAGQYWTISPSKAGVYIRFKTELRNNHHGPFAQNFDLRGPDGKLLLSSTYASDDVWSPPCEHHEYSPMWKENGLALLPPVKPVY